jgi:hypothetical protein
MFLKVRASIDRRIFAVIKATWDVVRIAQYSQFCAHWGLCARFTHRSHGTNATAPKASNLYLVSGMAAKVVERTPTMEGRETVAVVLTDKHHPGCGAGLLYFNRNRGVAFHVVSVLIVPDDSVVDER